MKPFSAALVILVCAFSIASAQSAGDIRVGTSGSGSSSQTNRNNDQRQSGMDPTSDGSWPAAPRVAKSSPQVYRAFVTNFLVTNDADKEIREIKWTATLTNKETHEPIGTFPLSTKKTIAPHKSRVFKEKVFVPLKKLRGQVVSANDPNDPNKPVPVDQTYEIIEIVYKDKSVVRP